MAAAIETLCKFLILILLCGLITSTEIHESTDSEDSVVSEEESSERISQQTDNTPGTWTIYEQKDFKKSELCQVLNCRRHELCLVRHNNAICVKKRKLDEIEGVKVYFKSPEASPTDNTGVAESESTSDTVQKPKSSLTNTEEQSQNEVDDQEWDHQKFREKMTNHQQKLRNKHKNKVKASLPNEVTANEHQQSHERHTKKMGAYEECAEEQLVAIEARLVQWFSDIHAQQAGERNPPLPKHKVTCREDIGWFFTQLDGDNNGKLSVDELNSLDHDPYEKCIKPFLDRCDINSDDVLSLNEWCDCFQWSGQEREEPACHAARRKQDPHLLGTFKPRCDVDGYYRPEQCHEGFCWCVDKWGREFDQSRTKGRPDCGQYAEPENNDDDDDDD